METLKFDVCVIGSGPAGFASAVRSYDFGKHVCIVESAHIGGAGITNGALSSKTMWELSSDYAIAKKRDRGYYAGGLRVDYCHMMKAVREAVHEKQYQLLSQIETFAKRDGSNESLTLLKGRAKFENNKSIIVTKSNGEEVRVEADDFVVATGSTPRQHPTIPTDGKRVINSDHIDALKSFPKRMMIVGAGIIGCEFATIFANFGESEVHLLDSQNRVIPFEDDDVSDYVDRKLTEIGVQTHHQASLREVRKEDDHLDVILDYADGHTEVVPVDLMLISIGRVPNLQDIGLENIDATLTDRGMLKVDADCRVCEHVYAAGDISGNMALVNIAEMEGRFAAKAMNNKIKYPLSYHNISTIMFFNPEVASIGLNEKDCQRKGISYKVIYYHHSLISRAIAMRDTDGFFKIIVSNEEDPLILGMRAAGPQSAASIVYMASMINSHQRLSEVMKTVHPHPSIGEGIQECLRSLSSKTILKQKAFPDKIKFRVWEA
jgi:dihydrolipoamide dehydrogenase